MEYLPVSARFLFNNGQKRFTIEFLYTINKWFVFIDKTSTDAVFTKEQKLKYTDVNIDCAADVLQEYLTQ